MAAEKLIFVSFASQERDLAMYLRELILEAFNRDDPKVEVFVSDTTITAGEIWEDEIKQHLEKADLMLVLCSPLSITRQWVNFECGVVSYRGNKGPMPIIPLCHSGLRFDDLMRLMPFIGWKTGSAIDVHDQEFLENVLEKVADNLGIKKPKIKNSSNYQARFFEIINKMFPQGTSTKPPTYLLVNLTNENNCIEIMESEELYKANDDAEEMEGWEDKIKKMHEFLYGSINTIPDVGLAIGIQNCLFDGKNKNIYVGVRMKSLTDKYSSTVRVAKTSFNTGYELLRENKAQKFQTIGSIQDLFVTMPWHIKKLVRPSTTIYEQMKKRVEALGSKLWRVRFSDGEKGVAVIFLNNSNRFPRFEIGVWKFIDISAEKLDEIGILEGFGHDIFLDYLGRDYKEETPVNYWIWVKDNEIFYWSFPEERLITRNKPAPYYTPPKNAALVTTKYMIENYGIWEKYTPFTSDANLAKSHGVLKDQFSFPARALLSCF